MKFLVLASLITFCFSVCHWKKEEIKSFFEIHPEYLANLENEKLPLDNKFQVFSAEFASTFEFVALAFSVSHIQTVFRRSRTKNAVVMGLKGINPVIELSSTTNVTNNLFKETCKSKIILGKGVFDVLLDLRLENSNFKISSVSTKTLTFSTSYSDKCLFTSKNAAEIKQKVEDQKFLNMISDLIYPKIAELLEKSVNRKNHILPSIADSAYSLSSFKVKSLFIYLEFNHKQNCSSKVDFFLERDNKSLTFFHNNLFLRNIPEFKATVEYLFKDTLFSFSNPNSIRFSPYWLNVTYKAKFSSNSREIEKSVVVMFHYTIQENNNLTIQPFKAKIDNSSFDFKESVNFSFELGDSQGKIRSFMNIGVLLEK